MNSSAVFSVPDGFFWGASTAAHQIEGNNTASDWWEIEHTPGNPLKEPSGDATDSFHRWPEDMDLLASAGFTDYRFSIEWARVEPAEGHFSQAALAHYRAMIDGALARGLRPLITLHHFTNPAWFARQGGWAAPGGVDRFLRYVQAVVPILRDGVTHVCTFNEPNMAGVVRRVLAEGIQVLAEGMPEPDAPTGAALIQAHERTRRLLREQLPHLLIGWSVSVIDVQPEPGAQAQADRWSLPRRDVFLDAAEGDDWIGVQNYTRIRIGDDGGRPVRIAPDPGTPRTLTGWEYYPAALGGAVRQVAARTGLPVIVTENGIATDDDETRIAYTTEALRSLREAMDDGVEVRGYFHWTLLDNYEWGDYTPTFGLISVDRVTFARTPKPSLAWLGGLRSVPGAQTRQRQKLRELPESGV